MRTLRQPANVVPPLIFPLAAAGREPRRPPAVDAAPGFPTHSFLAFALAVPFIQGALFATMNAGTDLARDIQTGFLNRLALTPMRGTRCSPASSAGVIVLGLIQAVVYLAVGLAVGVRFESGAGRRRSCCSCSRSLIALAFGALGAVPGAAHRLGRGGPGDLPAALRLPVHLLDEHRRAT